MRARSRKNSISIGTPFECRSFEDYEGETRAARRLDCNIRASLLEQIIKSGTRAPGRAFRRSGCLKPVWDKEVAEVSLLAIGDPLGVWLTAFVVRMLIIVIAVHAAMNIGRTLCAFIRARDVTLDRHFCSTVVADHKRLSSINLDAVIEIYHAGCRWRIVQAMNGLNLSAAPQRAQEESSRGSSHASRGKAMVGAASAATIALPREAWDEPRLLSSCARCGAALKFNPFIA